MATESTSTTTSLSLAADLVPVYIKEKLLMIAEKNTIFMDIGDKEDLPENNGKTVQFTRYERLPLPTTPLTESDSPASTALTTSIVQAVMDQWGQVVNISDVAELTVRHPVMRTALQRLGTAGAELMDREVQKVLMGSSNVYFPNARTSRSALVAGDFLGTDDIRKIVSTLRNNGAPNYDGTNYVGVFDPFVEMDISKDSTFVTAASYSIIKTLLNGEIGQWMGVRWKRSNFIPIITRISAGAASVGNVLPGAAGNLNSANMVGFANLNVQWKVTRLDSQTGFETAIGDSTAQTITAGDVLRITLTQATIGNGTYNIYASLEGGVAGTETFQLRVVVAGANVIIDIAKGIGTGTEVTTGNTPAIVVRATGALAPANASSAGNVHTTYVFGKESFGVVTLQGMKTYLTPQTASDSDPLVQRRKMGYKCFWKAVIKNTAFFTRAESLSAFN
jgi:N4-gp56 family major capsid protein